jgi:hypothetical protein
MYLCINAMLYLRCVIIERSHGPTVGDSVDIRYAHLLSYILNIELKTGVEDADMIFAIDGSGTTLAFELVVVFYNQHGCKQAASAWVEA